VICGDTVNARTIQILDLYSTARDSWSLFNPSFLPATFQHLPFTSAEIRIEKRDSSKITRGSCAVNCCPKECIAHVGNVEWLGLQEWLLVWRNGGMHGMVGDKEWHYALGNEKWFHEQRNGWKPGGFAGLGCLYIYITCYMLMGKRAERINTILFKG